MKKILVAEDDTFLASAYRVKLAKAGFEPIIARDGNEALEAVKKELPDCILLDLVMPVKDGFSVLEALKKDEKTKKIPVIVASNLGQKEDMDRAMSLGASAFVIKSNMSLEELIDKIKAFV